MLTALNLFKVTALLAVGFFYFLGLGWVVIRILLKQSSNQAWRENNPPTKFLPLFLTSGLIANYGISLLFQQLSLGLLAGAIISVIGLWNLSYGSITRLTNEPFHKFIENWVGVAVFFSFNLVPILFEPLDIWDARSIWFFHAKMIFVAKSFGISAGWQHPSVLLLNVDYPMHVDYPKLVSGIAAQITHVFGFWNEYIPKASLAFILLPALMWLFTFMRKSFSFLLLIFLPLSLSIWLWNGLMDGYLALYFSISMLLLGRYILQAKHIDLISSIICLTLSLNLKNEGVLAFLAGAIPIAMFMYIYRNRHIPFIQESTQWKQIVAFTIIIFLPFALWSLYKRQWGLSNDLNIGTSQSLFHILERINDKSYISILQQTIDKIDGALILLGILFFSSIAQNTKMPRVAFPILLASSIYFCGIFLIYLLTPHNLDWHLITSTNRTMLSVHGTILIACYYSLDSLERHMYHEKTIIRHGAS